MAKDSRGGKRSVDSEKGFITINGDKIEFDGELVYGDRQKLASEDIRNWENKRRFSKIEYAVIFDENGNIIGKEIRGGKNSVGVPEDLLKSPNLTLTHIHPGVTRLSGTLTYKDLKQFVENPIKTMRAVGREGTYSITKGAKFKAKEFDNYVWGVEKKFDDKTNKIYTSISSDYNDGRITLDKAKKIWDREFNNALLEQHEAMRKGQKQYGYTYSLERS